VSLRAAVPPDGQVVLESTPNGAGGAFYQEWQEAEETGYIQHFLPWWMEKGYRLSLLAPHNPTAQELELKELYGLDDEQLAYRRLQRSQCRGKFPQEYAETAEECFLLSGDCVFDVEKVDQRLKECEMTRGKDNAYQSVDNGRKLVFLPAQPKHEYIVGVDTAGGGSNGDYACAQVIDRESGIQCAELHGHFDPRETADRVVKLAQEYNNALLVIERNNHGGSVYERISSTHHYRNTYENRMNETKGWQTTVQTKPQIIQRLSDLIFDDVGMFSSVRFLRECRTFLRNADGSCSAASGAHDDTVMAMAIAHFVRNQMVGHRLCSADAPVGDAVACGEGRDPGAADFVANDVGTGHVTTAHVGTAHVGTCAPASVDANQSPSSKVLAPQAQYSIARHVSAGYT